MPNSSPPFSVEPFGVFYVCDFRCRIISLSFLDTICVQECRDSVRSEACDRRFGEYLLVLTGKEFFIKIERYSIHIVFEQLSDIWQHGQANESRAYGKLYITYTNMIRCIWKWTLEERNKNLESLD